MSERLVRGAIALLGVACVLNARPATAQATREELGARIDSLVAEYHAYAVAGQRLDSLRAVQASLLRTDTVSVGPFLIIERTAPAPGAVAALESAWQSHAHRVGRAAARLNGTVITQSLSHGDLANLRPQLRLFRFEPRATGSLDYASAAHRVMTDVLMDAMPDDVSAWLEGAVPGRGESLRWAYRDLATSSSRAARACFAGDADACREALTRGDSAHLSPVARASLLEHTLELGGGDSYARLLDDAPDIAARLAHAANRPIHDIMTSWRGAVQDARPRAFAGLVRAGFWTLAWLIGLALFAMRSTRWRL